MDAGAYESMVREMCEYVGLEDWKKVIRTRHLMIGEMLAGLIYDDQADASQLHVYFELGPTFPERDTSLYARMLAANLGRQGWLPGYLGLDPDTGQGVYHICIDLSTRPQGKWLADFLAAQADAASLLFQQLQ
jgi:hypothetical protein